MDDLPGLDAPTAAALRARAMPLSLPAGAVVFRPGALCTAFPLVTAGVVRVTRLSRQGHELLLYRVGPGETCIMTTACLLSGGPYAVSGVAETDLRALALPPAGFAALMAECDGFRHLVFRDYAARLAGLMARLESLAEPAAARLAERLLALAQGGIVHATHAALAVEIGASRETVSRALERLQAEGLVRLTRAAVEIADAPGLAAKFRDL
jgi:CRP/FNR family transcriptional regulator